MIRASYLFGDGQPCVHPVAMPLRTAQVVTRLDDELLVEVDELVAAGVVANRSDAVRQGLERLVGQHRRRRIGSAIVEAYRRQPQTAEELAGLDEATRALVNEEPW
jgi:Arc/MetJ-type ribon-helix-helix transcriptional regulator